MSPPQRQALILGSLGSLAFLALLIPFRHFTLDDTYIALRFSRHLAEGQGPVWNIGDAPVEGYTSFLWMLLNSWAIQLGVDPVGFSKVAGSACGLGVLWILALAGKRSQWPLGVALVAFVAASPAFAFLTIQGLETPLATLLITGMAALSLGARGPLRPASIVSFHGLAMLSMLTRPESILFVAGTLLGFLLLIAQRRDRRALLPLLAAGGLCFLLGLAYMAWRLETFGHLLPNTFYVKSGTGLSALRPTGAIYVLSYLGTTLLPYALLLFWKHRREGASPGAFAKVLPTFLGCSLYLAYLITIDPIQGFFGRFVLPIAPALLLAGSALGGRPTEENGKPPRRPRRTLTLAASAILLWNLRTLPEAFHHQRLRDQGDRVQAGKALNGLEGTMFTTASGALPYFSRWRSADMLGLSSERVAHEGVSKEFLQDLAPDLVIMRTPEPGRFRLSSARHKITESYMLRNGFVAIAAIHRSYDYYLCYFARRDSDLFDQINTRLQNIEDANFGDLHSLLSESDIPIHGTQGVG